MFVALVRRRFTPDQDVREITRYALETCRRSVLDLRMDQARVAEAMIRWALGELYVADGIPVEEAGMVVCAVTCDLAAALRLSEAEIVDLVVKAEEEAPFGTDRQ